MNLQKKEMEKGTKRLNYYASLNLKPKKVDTISRVNAKFYRIFFRAPNLEVIYENIKETEKDCIDWTPINKIPVGKMMEFHMEGSKKFWGIVLGKVHAGGRNEYLEIKAKLKELHIYIFIYNEKVQYLKPIL